MITRSFTARTYHFVGEYDETFVRVRPDGQCWLDVPCGLTRSQRIISRSQAAAVILALDASLVRGCDWRA